MRSSDSLSVFETCRLGLINVTVGMSALLVFGVLNRVMISEWQLSATLVGVLVFAHFVVCPIRTFAGYVSDTRPLWGWKRTPYIAGGMMVTLASLLLIFHSAQLLRTHLVLGTVASVIAFALWGIGINTASVSYLALMADLSGKNKARTVSIAWFMMVAFGIVATGICISVFFKLNLSKMSADVTTMDLATLDGVLFKLFYTVVGISALLVVLALVGMEPRHVKASLEEEVQLTFRETLAVVTSSRESKLFFGVVFLGIFGVNAQDILMEPYGAQILKMTLAQTNRAATGVGWRDARDDALRGTGGGPVYIEEKNNALRSAIMYVGFRRHDRRRNGEHPVVENRSDSAGSGERVVRGRRAVADDGDDPAGAGGHISRSLGHRPRRWPRRWRDWSPGLAGVESSG